MKLRKNLPSNSQDTREEIEDTVVNFYSCCHIYAPNNGDIGKLTIDFKTHDFKILLQIRKTHFTFHPERAPTTSPRPCSQGHRRHAATSTVRLPARPTNQRPNDHFAPIQRCTVLHFNSSELEMHRKIGNTPRGDWRCSLTGGTSPSRESSEPGGTAGRLDRVSLPLSVPAVTTELTHPVRPTPRHRMCDSVSSSHSKKSPSEFLITISIKAKWTRSFDSSA